MKVSDIIVEEDYTKTVATIKIELMQEIKNNQHRVSC